MARTYSVKIAALTLGVQAKWLDNLLSHHQLPGVQSTRQGVERAISDEGLLAAEIVRAAFTEFGVPIRRAVEIAAATLSDRSVVFRSHSGIELHFPLERIERRLRERLLEAVDAAPRVPRGRPPITK